MELIRADLHNHLRTSSNLKDGDFKEAIDCASVRMRNFYSCMYDSMLGVVDFEDNRYEKFSELNIYKGYERFFPGDEKRVFYVPEKRVFVVRGQEVPTLDGHILVLASCMNTKIKSGRSVDDTIREAKDDNAILVIDHPFYVNGLGDYILRNPEILNDIDAIEVHNGEAAFGVPFINWPFPQGANKRAQEFYKIVKEDFPNLGALASSDGHSFYEIGSSWTEMEKPSLESETEFLEQFRNSIRNTRDSKKQMFNSVFGAMDHVLDLATLKAFNK